MTCATQRLWSGVVHTYLSVQPTQRSLLGGAMFTFSQAAVHGEVESANTAFQNNLTLSPQLNRTVGRLKNECCVCRTHLHFSTTLSSFTFLEGLEGAF